jgi:ankyrin repeat protein
VSLLLSHGADPLLADNDMKTPLYWAAVSGARQVAQLLCDHLPLPPPAADAAGTAAASNAAAAGSNGSNGDGANTSSSSSSSGGAMRRPLTQVVSSLRSCALAAFSHENLPTFAVLIKELARRDSTAVSRLFQALGSHSAAAAAAVALQWAEDVTQQDGERVQLQEWAADVVAERMASQQLLLAVAGAATHLERLRAAASPSAADEQ